MKIISNDFISTQGAQNQKELIETRSTNLVPLKSVHIWMRTVRFIDSKVWFGSRPGAIFELSQI